MFLRLKIDIIFVVGDGNIFTRPTRTYPTAALIQYLQIFRFVKELMLTFRMVFIGMHILYINEMCRILSDLFFYMHMPHCNHAGKTHY